MYKLYQRVKRLEEHEKNVTEHVYKRKYVYGSAALSFWPSCSKPWDEWAEGEIEQLRKDMDCLLKHFKLCFKEVKAKRVLSASKDHDAT